MMLRSLALLGVILTGLRAQVYSQNNYISVSGDAEVKVVPDRVIVSIGVETRNPAMRTAKSANDAAVRAILAAAARNGVAAGDIQTDFVEINPIYQSRDSAESRENYLIDYYRVHKAMAITLRDVTQFENLLTAVVSAGANQVYGVDFQTSELRKHRDQAREMAVKAAVEKAQAMAAAAGVKVGAATSINSFNYGGGYTYGRWRNDPYSRGQSMMQNMTVSSGADPQSSSGFSPGRISIQASVTLTFPIVP